MNRKAFAGTIVVSTKVSNPTRLLSRQANWLAVSSGVLATAGEAEEDGAAIWGGLPQMASKLR